MIFWYRNRIKCLPFFNIVHPNIRSASKNWSLTNIITQFNSRFDIVVLSETWKLNVAHIFQLDGYDIVYNNGCLNQTDGVLVFVMDPRKLRILEISWLYGAGR